MLEASIDGDDNGDGKNFDGGDNEGGGRCHESRREEILVMCPPAEPRLAHPFVLNDSVMDCFLVGPETTKEKDEVNEPSPTVETKTLNEGDAIEDAAADKQVNENNGDDDVDGDDEEYLLEVPQDERHPTYTRTHTTKLMKAARKGDVDVVKLLCATGASVNESQPLMEWDRCPRLGFVN